LQFRTLFTGFDIMSSMNEDMLEVINEQEEIIGLEPRFKVHKEGLLHKEIHIWFVTPSGEIVFQHRAKDKDTYPDKLDATVGGHVDPGMTFDETAVKECKEETGLDLNINDLVLVKKMRQRAVDESTGLINNTIRNQYAYLLKEDISVLTPEEGKSSGFECWSIDSLPNLSQKDKDKFIDLCFSEDFIKLFFEIKEKLLV
jgi:isopentenyldiphosphate isomerase